MEDKVKRIGEMKFWLDDYRDYEYNESVECNFPLYGVADADLLSIGDYYQFCKQFAAAMGFRESTIEEWFGKY